MCIFTSSTQRLGGGSPRWHGACRTAAMIAGLAVWSPVSQAQWSVASLHPVGSIGSSLAGGAGGPGALQVGMAATSELATAAALWRGSPASWVNMHPAAATSSNINAAGRGQQVGVATIHGLSRAIPWTSTPESWIDLTPEGWTSSGAFGTDGVQQVGDGTSGEETHALLWTGSASSWIDLHPTGASLSFATCVSDGVQAGLAEFEVGDAVVRHASLWRGSAASWVDLHPQHALASSIDATDGLTQGGAILVPFADSERDHAATWQGTAASCVDLNPPGASQSRVLGISDEYQAGWAEVDSKFRAVVWRGTATSWLDLSLWLGPAFVSSTASSVWIDGEYIRVGGTAWNLAEGRPEAMLWSRRVRCVSDFNNSGLIGVQDIFDFLGPYFSASLSADVNISGAVDIQDVFDFLADYFANCA